MNSHFLLLHDSHQKRRPQRTQQTARGNETIKPRTVVASANTDSITKTHPQIDSIVLNSGIQRALNFTQPSNIDLGRVQLELTTNYTSYIYLLTHLLPHLQSLTPRRPASIIAVSSGLAVVPLPRCANYCASKAALHSLMWSLRAQLANDEGSRHIKVVEVLPPAVQTELHELQEELRAKGQTNFGMPLDEFTDECWEGLVRGDKEVPVGATKERFGGEEERRRVFERVVELMGTT